MSGATSRRKGKANELAVVHIAKEHGFPDAHRSWQTPQRTGDIGGIPGVYIEVRRRETLALPAWLREVEEACNDLAPVVAFKRNREPWYAAVRLEHFFDLLSNQREEQEQ